MATNTCTEFNVQADDLQSVLNYYFSPPCDKFFCKKRFFFQKCDCSLCKLAEIAKQIAGMNDKIVKSVSRKSIGLIRRKTLKQFCKFNAIQGYEGVASRVLEIFVIGVMFLLKDPSATFVDFVIENEFEGSFLFQHIEIRRLIRLNFNWCQSIIFQRKFLLETYSKLSNLGTDFFDRELLVGIEHNPGPEVHCASTLKRCIKIQKILCALEKLHKKQKEMNLKNERKEKKKLYFPEGLFEVGLDKESLDVLTNLTSSFLNGLHISHSIDFGVTGMINALLGGIQNYSQKVICFVKGTILIVTLFVNEKVFDLVSLFMGEKFYDSCEFRPEMNFIEMASHILMLIHSKYLFDCFTRYDFEKFVNTVSDLRKRSGEQSSALSFFIKFVKEFGTLICDSFGLPNPFDIDENPDVTRLQNEAKQISMEWRNGVSSDYLFAERVFILQSEIEDLLYEKRKTVDTQTKEKLTYMLRKFQPISNYCMRYINPNNGPRIEPLAILIAGPTGVGKSTITVPFLLALMSNILPLEKKEQFMKNHNDFLFFRNNENEFWDGYKMKSAAVVYDDFGQMRDVVGKPNLDAFEIIRLKNTAPYHLHFASLEDKQRNFAVPKLIFATTNLQKLYFDSLTCSEAVARRFDLSYIQVPKKEFCKDSVDPSIWGRRLDLDKVRKVYPDDGSMDSFISLEVVEFVPWDFLLGKQKEGEILGFDQILKLAISKFKTLNENGDRMLQFHNYMKNYVPEMDFKDCADLPHKMFEACAAIASKIPIYSKVSVSQEVKDKASVVVKVLAGVSLTLAAAYKIHSVFSGSLQESGYSKSEIKNKQVNVKKNLNKNRKLRNISSKTKEKFILPESNDMSLDAYLSVLKRNMYIVQVAGKNLGWCTFIAGRSFIMPRHFEYAIYSEKQDNCLVSFVNPMSGKVSVVLDWDEDLLVFDEHEDDEVPYDYMFFTIKNEKIRLHADISKYFASSEIIKKGDVYASQLCVRRNDSVVFQLPNIEIQDSETYYCGEFALKSRSLFYSCGTAPGDCGSILLTQDSRFGRPTILGFHTAGTSIGWSGKKNCIGVFISKEEVQRAIDAFCEVKIEEELPIMQVESFEGFNTLGKLKQPRVPTETKLIVSPLAPHLWERTMKPAYLKPFEKDGVLIRPKDIARKGYSHDEVYINSALLDEIFPVIASHVLKKNQQAPWDPKVFSFEEAVKGVDGIDYVDALNRTTSPGYPYVLENKQKGKKQWFGDDEFILNSKQAEIVQKNVENLIENCKNGKRNLNVFIDYLKDEKRSIAKADIGKTRQFMACGMDYLIAMKMYFGDFVRHICQNRIHNSIAVGINPYDEWGNLARYMAPDSQMCFTAGDYSKFDAKIPVPIAYQILKIINHFYYNGTNEDDAVREILFLDIVNSMHLSEGKLYEFVGGNPSGQPLTTIFNSLANLIMLCYNAACIGSCEENFDFPSLFSRTRIQVFGDDNIIGYDPCDLRFWEQKVLETTIPKNLGMDYTNEAKDGKEVSTRRLTEISFLKRSFKFEHGVWLCPLDIVTLKETLLWMKKNNDLQEMKLRIECVLGEFALHGEEIFKIYALKITKASIAAYQYVPKNSHFSIALNSNLRLSE